MTNEQILKKAIEIAVKNGWKEGKHWIACIDMIVQTEQTIDRQPFSIGNPYSIIFSHSFAQAFWGTGDTGGDPCNACGYNGCYKVWRYHLQQLVLEEQPLKYLEKFLDSTTSK